MYFNCCIRGYHTFVYGIFHVLICTYIHSQHPPGQTFEMRRKNVVFLRFFTFLDLRFLVDIFRIWAMSFGVCCGNFLLYNILYLIVSKYCFRSHVYCTCCWSRSLPTQPRNPGTTWHLKQKLKKSIKNVRVPLWRELSCHVLGCFKIKCAYSISPPAFDLLQ